MLSRGLLTRGLARAAGRRHKGTGVVMLNMGGPETLDQVEFFLSNLFTDPEIIPLPAQGLLGPLIGKRRAPKIREQYAAIGGGSPIGRWTREQGEMLVERLDELSPATAPHKFYVAFRYAHPLTEEAVTQMRADGVERAVAFSQYPQYSCTTTGSSLNHLWRELRRLDLQDAFRWSVLDRWYAHPGLARAVAGRVEEGLAQFDAADRDKVVVLFSAHSLPMKVVEKGDPYVSEVAGTVSHVMEELRGRGVGNAHVLAWQSKVGYLPWMAPSTSNSIAGLARQGHRHVLAVPIAFTSDHIETLYEIDEEYALEAKEAGIEHFRRAPSLNASPLLADAMAALVRDHLESGEECGPEYRLKCQQCVNPECRQVGP